MKEILLIGGGGHCKSVIDVIESEGRFMIAGIIDKPELLGLEVSGYKVLGTDKDLEVLSKQYQLALVTVGQIKTPKVRISLFKQLKTYGFTLPVIISPRAYVAKTVSVDEGTVVMHDVLLNAHAKIGQNCIINSKALIEHDSIVSNHCHISTSAVLNGNVTVGEGSFVGSCAVTREGVTISENSFIRAGSLVK
jgi:sugar O-acyltransferase (sialic acid O-acetyltransferase NeuD family)